MGYFINVERENEPLPTIEDFLPRIGEGNVFVLLSISLFTRYEYIIACKKI